MIPDAIKPTLHRLFDKCSALVGLQLPGYFNLKVKLRYLLRGIDEPDLGYVMERFIKPGDVVVDIGANVGLTARAFARACGPQGCVHAVEPERRNFGYLCANVLRYPWVVTHRLAFSASSGAVDLWLNPVSGTGNSFYRGNGGALQRVPCQTFDEFWESEGTERLDWVKIDVEGAELEVLKGMAESLRRYPRLKILIEYCPQNLEKAGVAPTAVLKYLTDFGFKPSAIVADDNGYRLVATDQPGDFMGGRDYLNLMLVRDLEAIPES